MKSREPRQSVIIPAQMRGDSGWSEVCIRNVSSHGMMLQMSKPPAPGCYVELRRATVVVVARVMWADADRCGLKTQARVDIGALSGAEGKSSGAAEPAGQRQKARADAIAAVTEGAMLAGRSVQFACGAAFGAGLAILLSLAAYDTLARPLSAVQAALR